MDCSIVYYIAHKTGYIQRTLTKKLRSMSQITIRSGYAAVSPGDLAVKFKKALGESELVIVIGGLSESGSGGTMAVLSEYFTKARLSVSSNKRIVNNGGDDGYLIKTGSRYVLVLPDDPDSVALMFGAELLKNIDSASAPGKKLAEPVLTHTVVFAPEPDTSFDRLKSRRPGILTVIGIITAAAVCAAAGIWIYLLYHQ